MDVLTAAWLGGGNGPRAAGEVSCARCGQPDQPLTAAGLVVSKAFTGYDSWQHPAGNRLCRACTWGYRTSELRRSAHQVWQDPPRLTRLAGHQLAAALAQPLTPDTALVVPLRPGRKHLLPTATWGQVTVDDVQLPWTAADASRFDLMRRLRRHGFGSRMLTEPAPAWTVLHQLSALQQQAVLQDWPELDVWRERRPWLELALTATAHLATTAARPGRSAA